MNKYLLMCAAAAMAAAASGQVARASVTVHLATGGGGTNFCSYFVITSGGGGLYAAKHVGGVTCAPTSVVYDAGVRDQKGEVPGGGSVQFADDTFAKAGLAFDGLDFDLGLPFGSARWAVVMSENGTSAFVLNSGYQMPGGPKPGAKKTVLHDAIVALGMKK